MAGIIRQPCDEGVIRSGSAKSACTPGAAPWVLAATILGSSMAFVDETAVTVALPAIQNALGATAVDAQWVVEAYTLFLAALVLVGGSLGDHLGRRRVFAAGVALFALASAWGGLSPSPEQLIAARAVQGVGGALLVPNSLAIIGAAFEEERRGKAIGTWASFTGVSMMLGPILGGYLAENLSWRGVFFINVPLALAVLVIAYTRVPESGDGEARSLDLPGAALAAVGLGGIVFGLLESSERGLGDPLVAGALVSGAVSLALFVVVEARRHEPMMPLELFRSRDFTGANLFTLLFYFALGGTLFFLPFNLIQVQGYSATAAGAAILPAILIMSLLSRYIGSLTDRYGARLPLVIGPGIAAVGFALFSVPGVEDGSYWTSFFPAAVVLGIGLSAQASAVTTVALNSVESRRTGLASAINNAFSHTAGLLAVAVLGVLMFTVFNASLDGRLEVLDLPVEARQQLEQEKNKLSAAEVPEDLGAATSMAVELAIDEAFVSGYRVIMLVAAGMSLASGLSAALLIEGKKTSETKSGKEVLRPGQTMRWVRPATLETSRVFLTSERRRRGSDSRRRGLGPKVGEDGKNPPVVGVGLDEPELAEDVLDVLLDRALGDVERPGDGVVGAPFGHEGEDLALAGREGGEPLVAPAAGEKLAYHFGIEHGPARGDLANCRDEVADIGDAILEQIADARGPRLEQLGAVALLDVLREHEHAKVGYAPADLDGRLEPLVAVAWRHPYVHHGDVGTV
jgi:EmrB/QacA subfamily drug resistance transporter